MAFDRKKKVDPNLLGGNPWLDNPEKGLSLIASLLARSAGLAGRPPQLDEMFRACDRLPDSDLESSFAEMRKIIELFDLPSRSRLLQNTVIVGFGGGFSSGKSSVLNSLLGREARYQLPVSTNPTTSISTYIMRGPEEKATACSTSGLEVLLEPDALDAISHKFRQKYGISLSQYIEFIGLSLPQFPCPGVAFLDTPGFNKADTATMQEHHDRTRSHKALSSVDHLVWIMDAHDTVLQTDDASFINDLELSGEITVILNKCDMYSDIYNAIDPDHQERVESVKRSLNEKNISFTEIIPYSANEPEWNNGRTRIISFLQKVAKGKRSGQERVEQMMATIMQIRNRFAEYLKNYHAEEIARIDAMLDASINPLELGAMAQIRGLLGFERASLAHDAKIFGRSADALQKWLSRKMEEANA